MFDPRPRHTNDVKNGDSCLPCLTLSIKKEDSTGLPSHTLVGTDFIWNGVARVCNSSSNNRSVNIYINQRGQGKEISIIIRQNSFR